MKYITFEYNEIECKCPSKYQFATDNLMVDLDEKDKIIRIYNLLKVKDKNDKKVIDYKKPYKVIITFKSLYRMNIVLSEFVRIFNIKDIECYLNMRDEGFTYGIQ